MRSFFRSNRWFEFRVFIPFSMALTCSETPTTSFRIWTRVAGSISYSNKTYDKCASFFSSYVRLHIPTQKNTHKHTHINMCVCVWTLMKEILLSLFGRVYKRGYKCTGFCLVHLSNCSMILINKIWLIFWPHLLLHLQPFPHLHIPHSEHKARQDRCNSAYFLMLLIISNYPQKTNSFFL